MPKRQPGLQNSPAVLAWVAAKTRKTIPVLLATNFPVLKSTRQDLIYRGKVTYNDSTGKIYIENIIVDFRMFQKHGIIPDNVDSDVVKALIRINERLQAISRYADHLYKKERFAMLFGRKNQVHSEEKDNGVGVEAEKSDSSKGVGEA